MSKQQRAGLMSQIEELRGQCSQKDSQLAREAPKTLRYLYENKRLAKELHEAKAKVEEMKKLLAELQETLEV